MAEFFIVSKKWTRGDLVMFWAPKSCGYTLFIDGAGRYTEEEARDATDGFRAKNTFAVPCETVEGKARRAVYADDLRALERKRRRAERSEKP